MAAIYNYQTGDVICEGLQGSNACDYAWHVACELAAEQDQPVVLDDDDGEWIIHPTGKRELLNE